MLIAPTVGVLLVRSSIIEGLWSVSASAFPAPAAFRSAPAPCTDEPIRLGRIGAGVFP
jgi:hypothetical protein